MLVYPSAELRNIYIYIYIYIYTHTYYRLQNVLNNNQSLLSTQIIININYAITKYTKNLYPSQRIRKLKQDGSILSHTDSNYI